MNKLKGKLEALGLREGCVSKKKRKKASFVVCEDCGEEVLIGSNCPTCVEPEERRYQSRRVILRKKKRKS